MFYSKVLLSCYEYFFFVLLFYIFWSLFCVEIKNNSTHEDNVKP